MVVAMRELRVLMASECSGMVLLRLVGIGSGGERSKGRADATTNTKKCSSPAAGRPLTEDSAPLDEDRVTAGARVSATIKGINRFWGIFHALFLACRRFAHP